jgi:ParB family chromosome partitioning protein
MNKRRDPNVRMIPLERIFVVNPRERGKRKFKQIVENIASLGLKKPITVTPKDSSKGIDEYYLVCGQGRYPPSFLENRHDEERARQTCLRGKREAHSD